MISHFKLTFVLIGILIVPILLTNTVNAQGIPFSAGVELTTSTDSPVPGQDLTITANSYSANINSAKITWTVDGKVVSSEVGKTTLNIKAPAIGKRMIVKFSAVTTDNIALSTSITITSGSIDLIIESDGYVHPFFKGKIPTVYQNTVKVIAVPHIANSAGVEYDPKSLVYQWKKNGRAIEDQSGYGKQSVTLEGDIVPRPYDLSVTATLRDGTAQAMGIISISASSPSLNFYVNDPLYGSMFNSAIKNQLRIGSQKEMGVIAVPYGFNVQQNNYNNLSLTWSINNSTRSELAGNKSIILRSPSGQAGSSNIKLDIKNNKNILQGANGGFSAVYTANNDDTTNTTVTF